jgi:hypothetical protein
MRRGHACNGLPPLQEEMQHCAFTQLQFRGEEHTRRETFFDSIFSSLRSDRRTRNRSGVFTVCLSAKRRCRPNDSTKRSIVFPLNAVEGLSAQIAQMDEQLPFLSTSFTDSISYQLAVYFCIGNNLA